MTTNSAPIRVGLVGCGYQGQWLAKAIGEIEGMRLGACVDPDEEAAHAVSAIAGGASILPSAEALVGSRDVDAVMVATPHHWLQPYATMAVNAGKHVLAEKPVALNAQQGRDLEAAVAQQGVTFMSGYSFRYFDHPAEAKQLLSEGAIGEIKTISAGMAIPRLRAGWPSEPAAGGGMLAFFGCHMIDRILWFLEARPVEVFADVRHDPKSGVDLICVLQMRFAGGATAQVSLCGGGVGPFDFAQICGSAGSMDLHADKFPHYALTVSNATDQATPNTNTSSLSREAAILKKMVAELNDFAEAIRQAHQPPITIEDACSVLEIMDAALLSGRTGQPVALRGSAPADGPAPHCQSAAPASASH